jgi:hypothetical protein
MGSAPKKPRPMKSRRNGLKHRDRINKNNEVIKKLSKS